MRSQIRRKWMLFGSFALLGASYLLSHSGNPVQAQQYKTIVPASGSTTGSVPVPSEKRVVAYVYGSMPITREEFGNYLIELFGKDRVREYVNRRVVEMAAAKKNIVITPQEVDAIIDQDCARLGVDKKQFISNVLKTRYNKTLKEWREDVIRPNLMMVALCKDHIKIDEEGMKKIYQNLYGEKVQCKVILWPPVNKDTAPEQNPYNLYDVMRKSDAEFDRLAKNQLNGDLAARGGEIAPIGRHSGPGTAKLEEIAFELKEGELSKLIPTPAGVMVVKATKKIPARTDVTFENVRPQLIKALSERMMEETMPKVYAQINAEANPLFVYTPRDLSAEEKEDRAKRLLKSGELMPAKDPANPKAVQPLPADPKVLAYVYGSTPITCEEFGDYLMDLYGQDRVRAYVNRRLIEMAAAKKGVTLSAKDIEELIKKDCEKLGFSREQFAANILNQHGKSLKEWTDDILKPRLMMQHLCREHIKIDDEGVKKVFANIYGEKVKCKVILWPYDQRRASLKQYDEIRQSDAEFDRVAKNQHSSTLASSGGVIDPIGRHSGPGTAKIEEIAFGLKVGELSTCIDTPGGIMVIKVVERIPARTDVKFEDVRKDMEKELGDRLMDEMVPKLFDQINAEAKPLFLFQPRNETRQELEDQTKRLANTDIPEPAKEKPKK